MTLVEAAQALRLDPRTVARWVDSGKLRGGRPRGADGKPVPNSHRWVDADHVRELAAHSPNHPQDLAS